MKCMWEPLLRVLPSGLRNALEIMEKDRLQEIRLRIGQRPEWILQERYEISGPVTGKEDLQYILNAASRYSPWTMGTISQGYVTLEGGHRVGLCGEVICRENRIQGIRSPESVCIRVSRDFSGIAEAASQLTGSTWIIGAPGWGKTTLLRDLARKKADEHTTVVVDERGELFPDGYIKGKRMDVLRLCPKKEGIEMALRTMGPEILVVDEITAEEDAMALLKAANCGVTLLATAHAASMEDLQTRKTYSQLVQQGVFANVLRMKKDKTWVLERMGTWL